MQNLNNLDFRSTCDDKHKNNICKKIIKKSIPIITFIGVLFGIFSVIFNFLDSKKQKEPFFVLNIKTEDSIRSITIINEGGVIRNATAELHYFIDIISAQNSDNPTKVVYFLGKETMDYNIEKHMFTHIEQLSFKEKPYCELMLYLREEKQPTAIVPFIYTYLLVKYEDGNDKQHTEVYLLEQGSDLTKKKVEDYDRLIYFANNSENIRAENIWEFYSSNRNKLGLSTKSSREERLEENKRPKTIEEYVNTYYQALNNNQRDYFISIYKKFADLT